MAYIYNMTDTWDNAGTTFSAIKMNVTDSASDPASLLMDLQVGSSSRFKVDKQGNVTSTSITVTSNVGIGTTTVATGTRLTVSNGNVNISSTGFGVVFPDGTFQTTASSGGGGGGVSLSEIRKMVSLRL